MPHSPWMPFYVGDYLADTAHLTTEQHGAYLLLLFACWTMAKLPDDDAKLMSISRVKSPDEWLKLRKTLEPFFRISRGFWEQKRVTFELQKSSKLAKQHSEGGKKAALIRWGNKVKTKDSSAYSSANSSAYGSAVTRARVPQPHKVSTDVDTKRERAETAEADFERFWLLYPRHAAKGRARKAYALACKKTSASEIEAAVQRYAAARAGQNKQYTPHPASWLNDECWLNEDDDPVPLENGHARRSPRSDRNAEAERQHADALDILAQAALDFDRRQGGSGTA